MRYRTLHLISPRAAGVILVFIGVVAFILLSTLNPVPAGTSAEAGHAAPVVVPAERNGLSW